MIFEINQTDAIAGYSWRDCTEFKSNWTGCVPSAT